MNSSNKTKYLILIIVAIFLIIGYLVVWNYEKIDSQNINNQIKNQINQNQNNEEKISMKVEVNVEENKEEVFEGNKEKNIINYAESLQQNDDINNVASEETVDNSSEDSDRKRIKIHSFNMEKKIENGKKVIENVSFTTNKENGVLDNTQNQIENSKPIIEYRVMFRTNGGNAIPSIYVEENKKALKPEQDPIKANTIFIGWFADKNLKTLYDFNLPMTSNIILYAGWKEEVDSTVVTAVDNFKLKNTSISKNGHNIRVSFSNSDLDIISMESALTKLFKDASSGNNYQSVIIAYNGKGFDYLNYSGKVVPLRFIGWFGKNNWSGSAGFDCKSGDFIGKSFSIEIKLKDGYLSENNNKTENYQVSFGN